MILEPVYCKKQQKKVTDQICGIGDLFHKSDSEWYKTDPGWTYIQSVWNHSGLSGVPYLFRKPVTGQGLFCCFLQQTGSSLTIIFITYYFY